MSLTVYNSMTRTKEPFETIEPGIVRMYVCGVTVYSDAHIGHARAFITFDIIRRYLEWTGYTVHHAQNFTDVDDKIINRARQLGITEEELTEQLIDDWAEETRALNILPATVYPRATQEIPEIVEMIEGLIRLEHAYLVEGGDVNYRVASFPEYGKLSGRKLEDMLAGARVEVDPRKEHPMDFALWKAAKPGEISWESPWGPGRPGWHIECSVMALQHLGNKLDIHGGGEDLDLPAPRERNRSVRGIPGEPTVRTLLDAQRTSAILGRQDEQVYRQPDQHPRTDRKRRLAIVPAHGAADRLSCSAELHRRGP